MMKSFFVQPASIPATRVPLVRSDSTPLGCGSKNEHSTFTEPKILYRFPEYADQPPPEVRMAPTSASNYLLECYYVRCVIFACHLEGSSDISWLEMPTLVSWRFYMVKVKAKDRHGNYWRCVIFEVNACISYMVGYIWHNRCFIFILEDKTIDLSKIHPDEEQGIDTGRTYGICVVHPRYAPVTDTCN